MLKGEDLSPFLEGDFSTEAVLSNGAGLVRAVRCIFDRSHVEARLPGAPQRQDQAAITITARAADLEGFGKRSTCLVDGATYSVIGNPEPDGTGLADLRLALIAG